MGAKIQATYLLKKHRGERKVHQVSPLVKKPRASSLPWHLIIPRLQIHNAYGICFS